MKKLHNSKIKKPKLKMSKGFEYTFIQRRYTNAPKVHEKINITNQEENSNLKKNEISGHTYQNGYHLKAHTIKQMFTRCG